MNNNNFVSKTLKTFLTSLFVSVFIFGSLYFFLSDNTSSTTSKPKDVKSASNSEKSKKLVVEDEKQENTTKVEDFVARQNETERQVLGATTDKLIAQNIPGTSDFTNLFQNTSPTPVITTPTVAITGTLPSNLATTTVYATGVPQTGNESLYIILGLFSTIAGFLIINGKSLAMRSFEQI